MRTVKEVYENLKISSSISADEKFWIEKVLAGYADGNPTMREMWSLLDEIWDYYKCDQNLVDERHAKFYSHPVWLLNGIHIETDDLSISNRHAFADWVVKLGIKRVADFGGGFGGLARLIGQYSKNCEVEIIDPFPHPAGIFLAEKTSNVSYKDKLVGTYDVIIATDVFEHVQDPLGLVLETSVHLNEGGYYLIGNCFHPVIKCHLPCTFHFRGSWDVILKSFGLEPKEKIRYARVFKRCKILDIETARELERRSCELYKMTRILPTRLQCLLTPFLLSI
jgi:hypothetical protein